MAMPMGDAEIPADVVSFLKTTSGINDIIELKAHVKLEDIKTLVFGLDLGVLVCSDGKNWRVAFGNHMSEMYRLDERPEEIIMVGPTRSLRVLWPHDFSIKNKDRVFVCTSLEKMGLVKFNLRLVFGVDIDVTPSRHKKEYLRRLMNKPADAA